MTRIRRLIWPLVFLTLVSSSAAAQTTNWFKAADTSSPRDTLRSFVEGCNALYDLIQETRCVDRTTSEHREMSFKILECLDTSSLPAFARDHHAGEAAVAIKEILDRSQFPPWDKIPDAKEIEAAGGYEKLSRWRIPDTRITIERAEEGLQKHEYLLSSGTVDRAVDYYHENVHRPYREDGPKTSPGFYDWFTSAPGHPVLGRMVEQLPDWMRFGKTWGLANWKWPGLVVLLILAVLFIRACYDLHAKVSKRVSPERPYKYFVPLLFPIAVALAPLAFLDLAERYLTIRSTPLYIVSFGAQLAAILAAVAVIFEASSRTAESIIATPRVDSQGLNAQLIRIAAKIFSILAVAILLILGGQHLGIPIGTLLASAGIGGIAIALGAQDTLKNVFATIALMADKPCRVGERIRFDKYDGFVEDIGLRSTNLRLLDGHLVTIPNEHLAGHSVENITRRDNIRQDTAIHLPLDTPSRKVERAIAIIREKLTNHEGMKPDLPPRVFFEEFKKEAFRIRYLYWYAPGDLWAFKAFNERLSLEIFRALETEGIPFSLPLRHSYWKHDEEQGPLEIQLVDPGATRRVDITPDEK